MNNKLIDYNNKSTHKEDNVYFVTTFLKCLIIIEGFRIVYKGEEFIKYCCENRIRVIKILSIKVVI